MNSPDRSPTFVIICFRYIGDVLVTTPLAVSIRQAYPDAAIDYMVFEGTEGVLAHNPLIRDVISLPRTGSNMGALLSRLRKYSVALAAYPSDRTVMAALLVGKKSIGLTYAGNKERWKNALLTAAPVCDDRYPVVSNMLALLSPLGIAPVPRVAVGYDQDDLAYARATMPTGDYVVMHPYSRSRCKYWPAGNWAELAVLLREQTGCQVIFTRTPDAEDAAYLEQILAETPSGVVAFRESCSLSRLAAAIKGSRAYIGIDTAVTHIAAAVEVPTIALMGPTLTRYWAPWPNGCTERSPFSARCGIQRSGYVTVIQKEWECVPCNRESCAISERDKMECLEAITPLEVVREVLEHVGRHDQ